MFYFYHTIQHIEGELAFICLESKNNKKYRVSHLITYDFDKYIFIEPPCIVQHNFIWYVQKLYIQ